MKIAMTGASGLVGRAATRALRADGHEVVRMVRRAPSADDEWSWDPDAGQVDERIGSADAVVHLAGENVGEGRWTSAKKKRIRDSRVIGTRVLVDALTAADPRPRVLVSASAIGIYGDRGEEVLSESAAAGKGFLADVCQEWEAMTEPAAAAGMRVVRIRIGMVLAKDGGALAKMLLPFRLGAGGKIGSGTQFMSWIGLPDLVEIIRHALVTESLSGPVNAVAPDPVTNAEFTRTLGRVLRRPTIIPMPAFAARAAFGPMADDLLLASTRVAPAALTANDFTFQHPKLEGALRDILGKR